MKFLFRVTQVAILFVLLFLLLIRTAIWFEREQAFDPWLSIAMGGVVATVILLVVFTLLQKWFFGKLGSWKSLKWRSYFALAIVGCFCLYSIFYLSDSNAKASDVRAEFNSLHPILRVAVSTTILADRTLLITDARRDIADYDAMGLPANLRSRHLPQNDGFVHAVDIRTNGHSDLRNWLVETTFRTMGLKTLRHVGTADHLHIELPSNR